MIKESHEMVRIWICTTTVQIVHFKIPTRFGTYLPKCVKIGNVIFIFRNHSMYGKLFPKCKKIKIIKRKTEFHIGPFQKIEFHQYRFRNVS
jgi:hypothetical protein